MGLPLFETAELLERGRRTGLAAPRTDADEH